MVRRVAIVGAGSSGLACMKICIDENLEPVCFESGDDIGGLWNFKESPAPGRSSIYRSLVANTSKEMMCFSDYPMPDDYPNYMHNSQLLQYFRHYAEHFHLLRYIHFQTTVTNVQQSPDFSLSGQWEVATVSKNGDEERHIFDAVMVCSGHYTHPALPLTDFQGHKAFSGQLVHSWEYKDADAYRGKKVVVVGIGSSGGDVASEISRCAKKTFLSTRQGAWVIGRMAHNGLPLDIEAISRFNNLLVQLLPKTLVSWVVERALNNKYDHRLYGLKPQHRALQRTPLINDDLPGRILQGALVIKPNIKEFKKSGVVFEDGTIEETIDAVIFCTGYNASFPFLPLSVTDGSSGKLVLFKKMFPPSLQHPTLAIMGLLQANGPIMPIVEMQARWAVKVFTGLSHLPSQEKMLEVIKSDRRSNMQRYPCPQQAALQVDYISYLDFMAKEVGVKINLLHLFLSDPVLWAKVFFGPCTPYQFRLMGPGQWAGARHAILTQWDRVFKPFRTRAVPEPEATKFVLRSTWLITFGGTLIILFLSKHKIIPILQHSYQILEYSNVFLKDLWFTITSKI
ncbi:flavin-containing monooxygenase 5 [Nematolebias whitei]|uniref:flavin-containing monooxygenase 5 n=1 Tax=Nematolebias whitei TaxID=451745 RepID=UPI00189A21AD|nr:flavin-containing monooxygenase 5 [Nematolebias whitei]